MKISYKQLTMMMFMSFISVKLLALPAWLYIDSGNMSWLVTLVLMIVDMLYAFLILDLMKKSGNKNIYEFLKETIGVFFAKLILAIFLIKYALVLAIIGKGTELFVIENLYEDYHWFLYGVPLLAVVGFMVYKGIRNIGRCFEFVFWLIFFCCLYIGFKSIAGVDVLSFLPMFKDGINPLLYGGYRHLSWFGSSVFMFMLFGKVSFKDEKKGRFFLFMFLAILLVMFLHFVFYGIFDNISPTHQFCISDIAQFSVKKTTISELSWFVVCMWICAQVIQFAMYGFCFVECLMYFFNINQKFVGVVFLDLYIIFWGIYGTTVSDTEALFLSDFASWVTIITEYIIPFIILIAYLFKHRKKKFKGVKNEKIKAHF